MFELGCLCVPLSEMTPFLKTAVLPFTLYFVDNIVKRREREIQWESFSPDHQITGMHRRQVDDRNHADVQFSI